MRKAWISLSLAFCLGISCQAAPQSSLAPLPSGASGASGATATATSSKPIEMKFKRGMIVVGKPKIWRSERIFALLDGLLRDVDSMTVRGLEGLDSNEINSSDITTIVNALSVSAKFDQSAGVNNLLAVEKAKAERNNDLKNLQFSQENAKRDQAFRGTLFDQRDELAKKLTILRAKENDLLAAGGDPQKDQALIQVANQESAVQKQIDSINSNLAGATTAGQPGTGIPDKTVPAGTSADDHSKDSLLAAIPDDLKKALAAKLVQPSFPPAMRMDNVIDLLHQRLSRELMVMYDDLVRQSQKYDIYLAQFDVSLNPQHGAKNRLARVSIDIEGATAYELYPSGSAYNILRALDKTTHIGLSGAAQSLMGLGLNASFSHDKEQLRSGLSQSMYVSAFGAGTSNFGWLFGPAPFESFLAPGIRTVHAILAVPAAPKGSKQQLTFLIHRCWDKQEKRYPMPADWFSRDECEEPSVSLVVDMPNDEKTMTVKRMSYSPMKTIPAAAVGGSGSAVAKPATATIEVTMQDPVDPNLTITANDRILRRVRDFRGRGLVLSNSSTETLAGTSNEANALTNSRFGILESDLALEPDTWYLANTRTILMTISKDTAGTDVFPVIRMNDPIQGGFELTELLEGADVRVDEWRIPEAPRTLPRSFFQPLFVEENKPGSISAYVESCDSGHVPCASKIRIVSNVKTPNRIWLHEEAQVMLDGKDGDDTHHWPLACSQDRGTLVCDFPRDRVLAGYKPPSKPPEAMKIWVDQAPYFGRPGLFADSDIDVTSIQPFALGSWFDVKVLPCRGKCENGQVWDGWSASIEVRNVDGDYCVQEFEEQANSAASTPLAMRIRQKKGLTFEQFQTTMPDYFTFDKTFALYSKRNLGCSNATVEVVQSPANTLTLKIPFDQAVNVTENLHLRPKTAGKPIITLPDYRLALMPDVETPFRLEDDRYRLEGDRLEAVDKVILIGSDGAAHEFKAVSGFRYVEFSYGKTLQAGTYSVALGVHGLRAPAKVMKEGGVVAALQIKVPERRKPAKKGQPTTKPQKSDTKATAKK